MDLRECTRCLAKQPPSLFTGYNSRCRPCLAELRRIERANRPPKPKRLTERDLTEKRCNACGVVKPVADFYWNQRKWSANCRPCTMESARQKRRANIDAEKVKERAADKRRRAKHPGRMRAYYAANAERLRTRERERQPLVAERHRVTSRVWRAKNPHRITEINLRRRARMAGAPAIEDIDRAAIIARDNSTCYLCSKVVSGRDCTLDHGIPLVRGGEHTAANLRVACRSCNSKKRHLTASEYLERIHNAALPFTNVTFSQAAQVASKTLANVQSSVDSSPS